MTRGRVVRKHSLRGGGSEPCEDDMNGHGGGWGAANLGRFHPVPTRPVFGFLNQYDAPPLRVVPAPTSDVLPREDYPHHFEEAPAPSQLSPQLPLAPLEPEEARVRQPRVERSR